jgi:hypothetical protein
MPTDHRFRTHHHQSVPPVEEPRKQRQPNPGDPINPPRLDAALDIERELAPQEEILRLDRPARSKCESTPAERLGD